MTLATVEVMPFIFFIVISEPLRAARARSHTMEFPITADQVVEAVRIVAERMGMRYGYRLYEDFALVGEAHIRMRDGGVVISTPVADAFIDLSGTVPTFRPCTGHAVCACHFARELWGVLSQIDNGLDWWTVADHLQDSLQEYSLERREWGEGNYVLRSPHGREEDIEVGIGDEFIAIGDDVIPLSLSLLEEYIDNQGF